MRENRRRIWFRVTWWSLLFGISVYPRGTKWLHLGPVKIPLTRRPFVKPKVERVSPDWDYRAPPAGGGGAGTDV